MEIRIARREDLEQLLEIYNYEVVHGVATLDLQPKTLEDWAMWFDVHNVDNHPLLVAEQDGRVAGYACLSSYRAKEAYRSTVELSIYIHPDFRRQGVATALMDVCPVSNNSLARCTRSSAKKAEKRAPVFSLKRRLT